MTGHRNPVMVAHRDLMSAQERLAEVVTNFAGSMTFVYVHVVWFTLWVAANTGLLGVTAFDPFPFGLLTLIVSLEAIFLSTFVMIGQNRQGRFAALKAEHDYQAQTLELQENTRLTREVHALVSATTKKAS